MFNYQVWSDLDEEVPMEEGQVSTQGLCPKMDIAMPPHHVPSIIVLSQALTAGAVHVDFHYSYSLSYL